VNRLSIRVHARHLLQEDIAQNWTDAFLDELINHAYHITQKEVMKVDPEAFLEWVRRNLTAGESFYARPEGDWWPNQVRVKDPDTGKYSKIDFKPFDEAENVGTSSGMVWARCGIYICVFPEPTTTIVNGLELIHVPTLTLAVDLDIPKIPLGLHLAIPYLVKIIALGETYQNYNRDVAMVQRIMGDMGTYFSTTGGENLKWRPDTVKPVGYAGS